MTLTRNERRQMEKLGSYVRHVYDTDHVFFEQHPNRKHRVRLASEVEIAQLEIMEGEVMTLLPGMRRFALVRSVVPGAACLRLYVTNDEGAPTGLEIPEDIAHAIFESRATPNTREMEAALRAAALEDGGAA